MTARVPKMEPTPVSVDDIKNHLQALIGLYAMSGRTGASYQSFVLENGRAWTPAKRPKGMRKRADKMCFRNSLDAAWFSTKYRYVEGYAASAYSGIVTEHAWLVDADDNVIDLTWRQPEYSAYYGIHIPTPIAGRYCSVLGVYGVLVNDWRLDCAILRLGRLPTLEELVDLEIERDKRRERSA